MDPDEIRERFTDIVSDIQADPSVENWNELRVFAEEDLSSSPAKEFHPDPKLGPLIFLSFFRSCRIYCVLIHQLNLFFI